MNDKQLYTEILGITSPWEVKDVQMDPTASQVEIIVDYTKSTAPCAVYRGDYEGALKYQVQLSLEENVVSGKIYDQLGIEERVMIQMRLKMGVKPGAIAVGLGRPASTIWCKLRRNGWVRPKTCHDPQMFFGGAGGYLADVAHRLARAGNARPQVVKRLQPGTALWDHVTRYLKARYSPDMRKEGSNTLQRGLFMATSEDYDMAMDTCPAGSYATPCSAGCVDIRPGPRNDCPSTPHASHWGEGVLRRTAQPLAM